MGWVVGGGEQTMEPDVSLPSYLLTMTRFTQLLFWPALPLALAASPSPSNERNTVIDPSISKWCILPPGQSPAPPLPSDLLYTIRR